VEGTGLGLALSKGLVEAMDGEIGFATQVDVGTTFWVELPAAENLLARYEAGANGRRGDGFGDTPALVVQIEDNRSNHRLVERILARQGNVRVMGALDGRSGIDLAREVGPDIILLDLHLPDIDGREVLRELRRLPETRTIPIIVLSAGATQTQVDRLVADGAAGYLSKPLDVDEFLDLLGRVRATAGS
jgi:CheY-like chemotaxis protein